MNIELAIIYGSITGNSKLLSQRLQLLLHKIGQSAELINAAKWSEYSLNNYKSLVIITSTWQEGSINEYTLEFFNQIPRFDLNGKEVSLIGLGDRLYGEENFCKATDLIANSVRESGGLIKREIMKIDGDPSEVTDEQLLSWWNQAST